MQAEPVLLGRDGELEEHVAQVVAVSVQRVAINLFQVPQVRQCGILVPDAWLDLTTRF